MVRAAVIGSGLAGLSAALFLARRGHRVAVLERDEDTLDGGTAGAWLRRGVGQASQTHAFLAASSKVMAEEAPDVLRKLEAAGAYRRRSPMLATEDDPDPPQAVFERRLAYEAVLRDVVQSEPNVALELGNEVSGLIARDGGQGCPRVVGVRTGRGDVDADLVVDASGRRSPVGAWLAEIGARPPVHESHPCGFFYLTRWYRLRPGQAFPDGTLPLPGRTHFGSFILCPAGCNQFSISLGLSEREPFRHALRRPDVFDAFVARVPRLAAWTAVGEGISQPQAFAGIANGRRCLVDEQGPIALGLVLVGDCALHTNPTLGRGTSLAFRHAQQLARTVEGVLDDPRAFIVAFEDWTNRHLGEWFDSQVAVDNEMTQRFHALAEGRALPALSAPAQRMLAMQALAMEDRAVATALTRLMHLLTPPSEIAADHAIQQRVRDYMDRNDIQEIREGVTRAEFAGWPAAS